MHHSPRVSVIVPVYCSRFLSECLASVRAQTRQPDEVIIVDDGSPGRLVPDISNWGHHNPKVKVMRQSNQGAGAARNRGIEAARGNLVALLDADDVWYPQFLAEQLSRLEMTGATLVYANGRIIGDSALAGRLFMDGAPSSGEVTVASLLAQRCTVLTSSVVVRREAILRAGGFDEALRRGQDFDLWVRLAHKGERFDYGTRPLLDRRVHADNLSGDRITELERARLVLEGLGRKLTLSPHEQRILGRRLRDLRAEADFERGKSWLAAGDFARARAAFVWAATAGGGWRMPAAAAAVALAPRAVRRLYFGKRDGLNGSVHSRSDAAGA
jgi:glycosyltransferase involved in cell wall biosynthesis